MSILPTTSSLSSAPTWDGDRRVAGGALAGDPPALKGDDEFTFGDFLSILNPLQHIPVVSNIYRWVTGDTIKPAARVVGGALYGGPIGLVSSALNAVVEQVKGGDIGSQLLALVTPDKKPADETQIAATASTPAPVAEGEAALRQLAADLRPNEMPAEDPKPAPSAAAAPPLPGQPRTLAFYQANAGQRIANVEPGRSGTPSKYSLPAFHQTAPAGKPLPIPAAEEKSGTTTDATTPQDGAPTAWFASAMMRGLDRYRASQQLNRAPPQLDVTQ